MKRHETDDTLRAPSKIVALVLIFVAALSAYIAMRFIRSGRGKFEHQDRGMARLGSIEARLDRLERRS
jgi:hypothetical protein